MAKYSAVIVFNDKDKEPIPLSGIEGEAVNIVKGNIDRMFVNGYVRVDGTFDEKATKTQKTSVVSKFFALEEIDHVDVVETKDLPQESKETKAARKKANKETK